MEMVINLLCAQEQEGGSRQTEELEKMDITEHDSHACETMEEDSGERNTSLSREKLQQTHSTSRSLCKASKGMELVLPFIPVLLEYLGSVIQGDERRNLQLEFSVLSK